MKTVIEAGHFYTCTGPTKLSLMGWDIGKQLAAEQPAALALFIDDYHSESSFAAGDETPTLPITPKQLTADADYTFYESTFAAAAQNAVTRLLDDRKIKQRGNAVSAGGVRLGTFLEDGELQPTCTLMDYLLLCEKTTIGGDQVTVLPEMYESQQAGLLVVANKLGVDGLRSYTIRLFTTDGRPQKKVSL